jgi:hypothetical protein
MYVGGVGGCGWVWVGVGGCACVLSKRQKHTVRQGWGGGGRETIPGTVIQRDRASASEPQRITYSERERQHTRVCASEQASERERERERERKRETLQVSAAQRTPARVPFSEGTI